MLLRRQEPGDIEPGIKLAEQARHDAELLGAGLITRQAEALLAEP
jgi:hypothetical protein